MTSWLVQNAILVVPLAVSAAVVCRLLRLRPALCHALWLIVLVKLLMPPLPVWRSEWLDLVASHKTTVARQPTSDDATSISLPAARPEVLASARLVEVIELQPQIDSSDRKDGSAAPDVVPPHHESPAFRSLLPIGNVKDLEDDSVSILTYIRPTFFLLWIVGAVIAVICQMRSASRLFRVISMSGAAPPSFCAEVALQCAKLKIRAPQMRFCIGLPCPMVLALPRVTLLWPAHLMDRLDAAGVRAVLVHELAHLKRRDHLTAWLEVIVACLWWWHPVVWWARRELRQYAELACDAWVVAALPGERSRYAKALIDVCEFISLAKPTAAPAVGMVRGNRRSFERRLHMILRQSIAARMPFAAWLAVAAVAIFVIPGFTIGQDSGERADSSEPVLKSKARVLSAESAQPTDAAAAIDSVTPPPSARPATGEPSDAAAPPPLGSAADPQAATDPDTVDQRYDKEYSEVQEFLSEARGKGRSLTEREKWRVRSVLKHGAEKARDARQRDDTIVNELYVQILGRRPSASELHIGLTNFRGKNFQVDSIVNSLLTSSEFIDGKRPQRAAVPSVLPEPHQTRRAKAQTLLRVAYDMPREKGEALARFLKEHVDAAHIDLRTVESGLVVTADANIQRTIVGVVSLMLGEPITLDLGNIPPAGYPMNSPVYYPRSPYGPPTYNSTETPAQSGLPGVFLPAEPQSGRMIVPRTVVDPQTGTRRTVYEERVYDGAQATDDPSTPRFTNPILEEKKQSATTKESPETEARRADMQ
jgi:beta-lactamase regulating signal transducer with metallopeptidase domain